MKLKKETVSWPSLTMAGIIMGLSISIWGGESFMPLGRKIPLEIKTLNNMIGEFQRTLTTPEKGHKYENHLKDSRMNIHINFSGDCKLRLKAFNFRKNPVTKVFEEDGSQELALELGNSTSITGVDNDRLGYGIKIKGALPEEMAQIFFSKNDKRNTFLTKFQKLNDICQEKTSVLHLQASQLIQKVQASPGCDLGTAIAKKNFPSDDLDSFRKIIRSYQSEHLADMMKEYQEKFGGFHIEELASQQVPEFIKFGLDFLELLENDFSLALEIPFPTLVKMIKKISRLSGERYIPPQVKNGQEQISQKLKLIFNKKNTAFLDILMENGLSREIVLTSKWNSETPFTLDEIHELLKSEKDFLSLHDLANGDGKDQNFNLVKDQANIRLHLLAELYKNANPKAYQRIFGHYDMDQTQVALTDKVKEIEVNFKKQEMLELLEEFENNFNIYNKKDLEAKINEQNFNPFALRFLDLLAVHPSLIRKIGHKQLIDILKLIPLFSGGNEEVNQKFQNLLVNKSPYFLSHLLKTDGRQNNAILDIYEKKSKIFTSDFYNFLKEENDILWLVTVRNGQVATMLENAKADNPADFQTLKQKEQKIMEDFDMLVKISQFRMALLLKYYQEARPNDWRKKIEEGRTTENIRLDRDFEHYGRWGVAGDILEEMIKYETKLEEKTEWKERKVSHDILVKSVLKNMDSFTNIKRLMEFASNLNLNLPNLKTTALQEMIQLYSELK